MYSILWETMTVRKSNFNNTLIKHNYGYINYHYYGRVLNGREAQINERYIYQLEEFIHKKNWITLKNNLLLSRYIDGIYQFSYCNSESLIWIFVEGDASRLLSLQTKNKVLGNSILQTLYPKWRTAEIYLDRIQKVTEKPCLRNVLEKENQTNKTQSLNRPKSLSRINNIQRSGS